MVVWWVLGAAAIAWSAWYALPHRVVVPELSGGTAGIWCTIACAVELLALGTAVVWQGRGAAVATCGAALLLVLPAYAAFEHNRLWFLLPLVAGVAVLGGAALVEGLREQVGTASAQSGTPAAWRRVLLVGAAALVAVHVVAMCTVAAGDVGRSSALGAAALLHGRSPYADPAVVANAGQTYGPFAYELYVPARAVLGGLHAQVAMAIVGHLALVAAAAWVGLRRWGRDGALVALVAVLVLPTSSHTSSVAAHDDWATALVLAAIAVRRPAWVGVLLGLAATIKLLPAVLLLLLVAREPGVRARLAVVAGFVAALAATLVPVLAIGSTSLRTIVDLTVRNQGSRAGISIWNEPMSTWTHGLAGHLYNLGLGDESQAPALQRLVRVVVLLGIALLAYRVATRARAAAVPTAGRLLDDARVAALAAASTCAVVLTLGNFSWNYVSWFLPLVAVGVLAPALLSASSPDAGPIVDADARAD